VHPEAQPLTERSVSSCIWLAYSIRSKNLGQSNAWAYWAISERFRFWIHPMCIIALMVSRLEIASPRITILSIQTIRVRCYNRTRRTLPLVQVIASFNFLKRPILMQGITLLFITILLNFYLLNTRNHCTSIKYTKAIRVKWSNKIRRIFTLVQILRHLIFWKGLFLCNVLHYYLLCFFVFLNTKSRM